MPAVTTRLSDTSNHSNRDCYVATTFLLDLLGKLRCISRSTYEEVCDRWDVLPLMW